tara:strand:- start:3084 stop:4754 length:1671 start_codon:yes stop_codon:yes gene_type:complete
MNPPKEMVDDFRNHLWACFKYLGLGEPTAAQYGMAECLQDGPTDMQLQAGRGFGKSVITACLASWFLLRDPNATIMVVSATGNKAAEFISMTRRILDLVPYCEHLKPGDHTTDNAFAFNVEARTKIGQDKSCFARGIGSQITGSHADYVIADDVEIEGNCETAASREKLLVKISEFEQIRNVGGRVLFLGTPQIQESVYNKLKDGYPVFKFPAIMPDKENPTESVDVSDWIWECGIEVGKPTQPERFSEEVLMERLAKIGPRLFALHYKLDTTLSDIAKYPLKLRDLVVIDINPEVCPEKIVWASSTANKQVPSFGFAGDLIYEPMWISDNYIPYIQTAMFIDPSGRGKDETSVCVASTANGYIFIHELLGYEGGYDTPTISKIAKLAYQYNIKLIRVESNFGDAMFAQVLRPKIAEYCGQVAIEDYRVSGAKEARIINIVEPIMAQHRLVLDTNVAKDKENQYQITRIHGGRGALRHDDRIDVLSAAVKYWEDALGLDVDQTIQRNQRQEKEEVIKNWLSDNRFYGLLGDKASGALRLQKQPPRKNNKWSIKRRK